MSDKIVELRPLRVEKESAVAMDQLWELRRSFLSIHDEEIRATLLDLVRSVAQSQ